MWVERAEAEELAEWGVAKARGRVRTRTAIKKKVIMRLIKEG